MSSVTRQNACPSAAQSRAVEGHAFCLVGRNVERLEAIARDLEVRGAAATHVVAADCNAFERHAALIGEAFQTLGGVDVALIAHGTLGDQAACERDFALVLAEFNTNALSVMSLLTHLANRMADQGHGSIAVIGSVAGDRGRQSNYVYGAAKGAVATFLQGLRQRLQKSGVQVLTVKPGFVDTPMTGAFSKGLLWVGPETIARAIAKGVERRRDVIYAPAFWWLIMALIKATPETVFKRLRL